MTEPRAARPLSRPTAEDRRAVIAAAGGHCSQCGEGDVALEIRLKIARRDGGSAELENLEAVCPNCQRILDSGPSELFFVQFLTGLLEGNPDYTNIAQEPALAERRLRPDLLATENRGRRQRELIIECKSFPVLTQQRVEEIRDQLEAYRAAAPERQMVLAFPGQTAPEAAAALRADGIEIWDIDLIGTRFAAQIEASGDGYYPAMIERAIARARPEAGYLAEIRAIAPGKEGWNTYQKLIGRLLELLFCPPLGSPLGEKNDFGKFNRRDLIFANHALEGFWAALRQRYGADYILVDAKNGAKVRKSDVLQIANYLKPHGLGMFAIIVGRGGIERGVPAALRDQWAFHQKMILLLDDEDLEEMVLAYGTGREQTQVLSEKIQAFRIGM